MSKKQQKVRVRMAPSPTGEYHVGHLRTLLFNWAFAKKHDGEFILRIEDTDRERFVKDAENRIINVIKDYGLSWDEGPDVGGPHSPYRQSERLDIYKKYIKILVDDGKAYHCFCTKERLNNMREEQKKKGIASPKYDRKCLGLEKNVIEQKIEDGEEYVIRLKVPEHQDITFSDIVLGDITINSEILDDQVLMKSDDYPTYHFGVVVDDHLMGITHVIRGNDWVSSTPKHVILYDYFDWELPQYAHVPNIKEIGEGKKLSKRHGSVTAREFLEEGYLPEAMLNFLMLLGWNPGTEQELFDLKEFTEEFTLEKIQKTDLVSFDRDKLLWMNGEYIKNMKNNRLTTKISKFYEGKYDEKKLNETVPLVKERMKKLSDYESLAGFFYKEPKVEKSLLGENWKDHIKGAITSLESVNKWELNRINDSLMSLIDKNDLHTGKFFMDLRIAITGKKVTPPINESLVVLGKKVTMERLKKLETRSVS